MGQAGYRESEIPVILKRKRSDVFMAEKQELRISLSEAKAYGNGKDVFCELLHTGKIGEYGLAHIQWKEDGVDGIVSFEANHRLTPFERDDIK